MNIIHKGIQKVLVISSVRERMNKLEATLHRVAFRTRLPGSGRAPKPGSTLAERWDDLIGEQFQVRLDPTRRETWR